MSLPVRVVLANLPRITNDILRVVVERQPDLRVVGEADRLDELSRALEALRADAVIVGVRRGGPRPVAALREAHPLLTFLELLVHDDLALLWLPSLAPRPVELSASGIVAALRKEVVSP